MRSSYLLLDNLVLFFDLYRLLEKFRKISLKSWFNSEYLRPMMYLNSSFLFVLMGFRLLLKGRFHANMWCTSHFYTSPPEHFKILKMVHLGSQGDWSGMLYSWTELGLGLQLPIKVERGKHQTQAHKCSLPVEVRLSPAHTV